MAACADNLLCAPLKDQKLAGTGVGFCNLTKGGDVSFALQANDQTWQPAFQMGICILNGDDSMLVGAILKAHGDRGTRQTCAKYLERHQNTSCAVQYERPVDMRPQYFLGGAKQAQQQAASPKAAAQSVTNDASGGSVGAVNGLKDVTVSTRVTSDGAACKLPVVYK